MREKQRRVCAKCPVLGREAGTPPPPHPRSLLGLQGEEKPLPANLSGSELCLVPRRAAGCGSTAAAPAPSPRRAPAQVPVEAAGGEGLLPGSRPRRTSQRGFGGGWPARLHQQRMGMAAAGSRNPYSSARKIRTPPACFGGIRLNFSGASSRVLTGRAHLSATSKARSRSPAPL